MKKLLYYQSQDLLVIDEIGYLPLGQSFIWLGRILGRSDPSKRDEAEEDILRGIKILEKLNSKPFSTLGRLFRGECYLETGEKEKAMENLKDAELMFQQMGMEYWRDRTRKLMERT